VHFQEGTIADNTYKMTILKIPDVLNCTQKVHHGSRSESIGWIDFLLDSMNMYMPKFFWDFLS